MGVAVRLHLLPAARACSAARAGIPRARLTCFVASPRSTSSRTRHTSATRSRSCSTATASRATRCSGSRRRQPVGDDVRRYRDGSSRRLRRPHLRHGQRVAVRWPPDARDMPRVAGRRRASAGRRADRPGVRRRPRRRAAYRRQPGFRSPQPFRSGPVDEALVGRIAEVLRIEREAIIDTQWAANGPNWVVALLPSADAVHAIEPGFVDFDLGVVGPYPAGSPAAFEVRAFFPKDGRTAEDPSPGASTGHSRNGWYEPAAPRCRTWPARAARSAAPAASTFRQTTTARSGWPAGP